MTQVSLERSARQETCAGSAELHVYVRAPGAVARCPHCGNVMLVVVESGGSTHAHLDGVDLLS